MTYIHCLSLSAVGILLPSVSHIKYRVRDIFAIKHTCHFRLDSEYVPLLNYWICMNIYGIVAGVTACEVITLQMERMDVSHTIFYVYNCTDIKSLLEIMAYKRAW